MGDNHSRNSSTISTGRGGTIFVIILVKLVLLFVILFLFLFSFLFLSLYLSLPLSLPLFRLLFLFLVHILILTLILILILILGCLLSLSIHQVPHRAIRNMTIFGIIMPCFRSEIEIVNVSNRKTGYRSWRVQGEVWGRGHWVEIRHGESSYRS